MQVPLNGCCVGGPVQEQSPVNPAVLFVLAAIYAVFGLIVLAATAIALA